MNISAKPGSVRLTFRGFDGSGAPIKVDHVPIDTFPEIRVTIKPEPGSLARFAEATMKQEHGFKITADDRVGYFHYVTHANVAAWTARGWIIADDLAGTNHGNFAVLMKWNGTGEPPEEQARQA